MDELLSFYNYLILYAFQIYIFAEKKTILFCYCTNRLLINEIIAYKHVENNKNGIKYMLSYINVVDIYFTWSAGLKKNIIEMYLV